MSDEAILSNVFVMLIAGHETTATVLLVTMMELAINVDWQRRLQKDIDSIFGDRPSASWDMHNELEEFFGSSGGATLNEGKAYNYESRTSS